MNRCQGCWNTFKLDLLIPDELWEQIKPEGKLKGAGLLCPTCIVRKIENIYNYAAMKADFISPKQDVIKSVCEHTVYDLIYRKKHSAKCKCGTEWNYL